MIRFVRLRLFGNIAARSWHFCFAAKNQTFGGAPGQGPRFVSLESVEHRLINFRFGRNCGLKSVIALSPKSAMYRHGSRIAK
jgi:hypothetical protein